MKNFKLKPIPVLKEKEEEEIQNRTNQGAVSDSQTFVNIHVKINKRLADEIKDYAYQERITQKEVISQAIEQFLADKTIEIRPKKV
jgi:hypothetical protein